ncbi:GNAT family N-acetyltransferase [Streptomyces sp. TRM43335]|uniref:GNAT family N-acetyltransferase n=1 Tax=Streptomyces taklimakanensis TaxID=2569853 RepID=A0A6G2BJG2_9ACTN|nr:GNAT family N-acetyltransferase [Streptomyces taklimakanensis]
MATGTARADRPSVRAALPEEAVRLSELAIRSKAHWGYDGAFVAACREELTLRPDEVTRRRTAVAERDGEILGFVTVEGRPPHGSIGLMFVDPPAIGQGVGRLLFEDALHRARAAGFTRLSVDADPNAEGFYRAMGAVRTGTAPSGSIPGRVLPQLAVRVPETDPDRAAEGPGSAGRDADGAASRRLLRPSARPSGERP